jgi:hypothetical protein
MMACSCRRSVSCGRPWRCGRSSFMSKRRLRRSTTSNYVICWIRAAES